MTRGSVNPVQAIRKVFVQTYAYFESLIFGFCERYQISLIQPDQYLNYTLFVDGVEIKCYMQASSIVVRAVVPEEYAMDDQSVCKTIMKQSFYESFSSGNVVSLDDDQRITFFKKMPVDQCSLSDFENLIEAVINGVEGFREALEA